MLSLSRRVPLHLSSAFATYVAIAMQDCVFAAGSAVPLLPALVFIAIDSCCFAFSGLRRLFFVGFMVGCLVGVG